MEKKNEANREQNGTKQAEAYVDDCGNEYREHPGKYSFAMTEAVARGLSRRALLGEGLPWEKKEALWECAGTVRELNLALARRLDDLKAGRELIEYDYDAARAAVQKLAGVAEKEDPLIAAALRRILVMDNWAYAAEQRVAIRDALFQGSVREYGSEGNRVGGLGEEEERNLRELCKTRSSMLALLLRMDVLSDMHQTVLDILEAMDIATQAILNRSLDALLEAAEVQ